MKNTILIILGIFTLFSCETKTLSEPKSEDIRDKYKSTSLTELGEEVFTLLKENNYEAILELMPTVENRKSILNNSVLPEDEKKSNLSQIENRVKSDLEILRKSYLSLIEQSKKAGINWKNCKLEYIDFVHIYLNKIESGHIYIKFSFKGVKYDVRILNFRRLNNEWLMGNEFTWGTSMNDDWN